ncbi:MAG: UbiH/UbiF/VisC/COQ6 family ubiquinone biosynthesis hydroxylase [Alphaproteobacteria bacterium]|nr:UbiH/UbiF/VisC/COQ6 family ubiquinone biosynthesis hydroxylase [Alphaproteobacteria bacterium]
MNGDGQSGETVRCDVAIIGGGMAGATLALALQSVGVGVVVIERDDPGRWADQAFDGRVSAIAAGSRQVWQSLGAWEAMARDAEPILDIRVTDGDQPFVLHFDHQELGGGPMGHILENRRIRAALLDAVEAAPGIRLMAPRGVAGIERDAAAAVVTLEGGGAVQALLVVGADGRGSQVRESAGINQTAWRYGQGAIVTTVLHERPHEGTAEERFLDPGPFAILPMTDDEEGRHRSSIVWTDRADLVPAYLDLGASDFNAELAVRFGDHLGAVQATGPRWSYPLGLNLAESYIAPRLALIGDAAHGIHPIAGQGLNLGIRDAAALAEVVVDARRLGLDFGMTTVLDDYQRWRRFDNVALAAATDVINRLFSNPLSPLRLVRGLGLAAVNRLGPARRLFMREAMGLAGDLPRLVRGETL